MGKGGSKVTLMRRTKVPQRADATDYNVKAAILRSCLLLFVEWQRQEG